VWAPALYFEHVTLSLSNYVQFLYSDNSALLFLSPSLSLSRVFCPQVISRAAPQWEDRFVSYSLLAAAVAAARGETAYDPTNVGPGGASSSSSSGASGAGASTAPGSTVTPREVVSAAINLGERSGERLYVRFLITIQKARLDHTMTRRLGPSLVTPFHAAVIFHRRVVWGAHFVGGGVRRRVAGLPLLLRRRAHGAQPGPGERLDFVFAFCFFVLILRLLRLRLRISYNNFGREGEMGMCAQLLCLLVIFLVWCS